MSGAVPIGWEGHDIEDFKLQVFARERPGRTFPEFRRLRPLAAERLSIVLAGRAGLEGDLGGRTLRLALLKGSRPIERVHAEEEGFDLASVAATLGLGPQEEVYVNWDDSETIHRVRFGDWAENFDYVWYPRPDDIEIFDDSFSWALSVDHGGYLRAWRPGHLDERSGRCG